MHLLNCLNPKRVYNKYTNEFVWVPCRECDYCRNAHAARWTSAIEREREMSRFSMFVTLTYDEVHLPVLDFGHFGFSYKNFDFCTMGKDPVLVPSKEDDLEIRYSELTDLCCNKADKDLLDGLLRYGGVPYGSTKDLQNFHKRLNKYIHDKITFTYKNFRFFVCQEYGEGCFRPHFHGIYFINDSRVAERFSECVLSAWKQGRIDCQFVEKSAGAYVAGYVNKSADLPYFYKKGPLRQRFYFSRFPSIGDVQQSEKEITEIYHKGLTSTIQRDSRNREKFIDVPLSQSLQNRLFGKCFSFGSLSSSARVALYTINRRFAARSAGHLMWSLIRYTEITPITNEFDALLHSYMQEFNGVYSVLFNWCKRLYYVSKRFLDNCRKFNSSIEYCYSRIIQYWNNKDMVRLNNFYGFQQEYSLKDPDSLVLMYPEFAYANFGYGSFSLDEAIKIFEPIDYNSMKIDSAFYAESNKKTKDKNDYIDKKIKSRDNPIFYKLIKSYFHAKKCYEVG